MTRTLTIDPITRLEGDGRITIILDDEGEVERAIFQVPELRGFESFVLGRPVVDMPQITSRICGVCPTAHHLAATKALDALYGVTPPPAARAIRDLIYQAFMLEDHALHFYFLGGPDFFVGPRASRDKRNILGVIEALGREVASQILDVRRRLREMITLLGGKVIHPVFGLPGGVTKAVDPSLRDDLVALGGSAVAFAEDSVRHFHDIVLPGEGWATFSADVTPHRTHYMGLVDKKNQPNFVDGELRVVTPDGDELARFPAERYREFIAEHVEPWTYVTFPHLRDPGWKGFVDGPESGILRVAPLARINVSTSMATPRAQEERERLVEGCGGAPVHETRAYHWARCVEMVQAAETILQLVSSEELYDPEVRCLDFGTPHHGIGCVEAPRGTLIHDYETDERGLITNCNLVVATEHNAAAICLSLENAARRHIRKGKVDDTDETLLNSIEMAFRAYDPCLACSTHSLPGQMPLTVDIVDQAGARLERLIRTPPRD